MEGNQDHVYGFVFSQRIQINMQLKHPLVKKKRRELELYGCISYVLEVIAE